MVKIQTDLVAAALYTKYFIFYFLYLFYVVFISNHEIEYIYMYFKQLISFLGLG